jgi:hypothetical protein
MYDECFRLATFLDPNYGPGFFDKCKQSEINEILRNIIKLNSSNPDENNKENGNCATSKPGVDRFKRYSFGDGDEEANKCNSTELITYLKLLKVNTIQCPLEFWKTHEKTLPILADTAKKVLGVPATSASVERLFNIAGHIYQSKRRRMTPNFYSEYVFCKLNEKLL